MQLPLSGLWQLSPLTDLSIPQDDLCFPAPLSSVLPDSLSEDDIAQQEWHLMHDVEVEESLMAFSAIDLVMSGIEHYAEVRLNGIPVFDCDGTQAVYRKDIRPYLQLGKNRFEVLFLEQDDDCLLGDEIPADICTLGHSDLKRDQRMGIWTTPFLQCIRHIRLDHITTEQIWHHGGGCEFLVELHYTTYSSGLVSATVKFNGMTYQLPIDVRSDHASALFQVEAPIYFDAALVQSDQLDANSYYHLAVELDGQKREFKIGLSRDLCVTHFPL